MVGAITRTRVRARALAGLPKTLTGKIGTAATTYVSGSTYLDWGQLFSVGTGPVGGNTETIVWGYGEGTLRLSSISAYGPNWRAQESMGIVYDPAGRVTQVDDTWFGGNPDDNQCFAYDYQGHLTQAWTPSGSVCTAGRSQAGLSGPAPYWNSYAVDTVGNVTGATLRTPTSSTSVSYGRPASGASSVRPHAVTSASRSGSASGTSSYSYDAAGHVTGRPGPSGVQALVWDETGALSKVTQGGSVVGLMVYGADGSRLVRQQGGATTVFLGDTEVSLSGSVVSAVRYYSHNGVSVAVRSGNAAADVQLTIPGRDGSIHAMASKSAPSLFGVARLDPYGGRRGGAGSYDPVTGSFASADPVVSAGRPGSLNAYVYGYASPVSWQDPSGRFAYPVTDDGEMVVRGSPGTGSPSPAPVTASGAPSKPSTAGFGDRVKKSLADGGNAVASFLGAAGDHPDDLAKALLGGVVMVGGTALASGGVVVGSTVVLAPAGAGAVILGGSIVTAGAGLSAVALQDIVGHAATDSRRQPFGKSGGSASSGTSRQPQYFSPEAEPPSPSRITGYSDHLWERISERGITLNDVQDVFGNSEPRWQGTHGTFKYTWRDMVVTVYPDGTVATAFWVEP